MEDVGWQPINETNFLVADLVGLINGPLYVDAITVLTDDSGLATGFEGSDPLPLW